MDSAMAPFAVLRQELRAAGFVVNPWRLGRKAGEAGVELPCPYSNPRSVKLYRDGWSKGYAEFKRQRRAGIAP